MMWLHTREVLTRLAGQRLVREGLWVALGTALSALAQVVGTRVITQFAAPEVFGTVSLLLGASILAKNLTSTPLMQSQNRLYSDALRTGNLPELRQAISTSLKWLAGIAAGVTILYGILFGHAHNASVVAFVWLALLFVSDVYRTFEMGFLQIARRQKEATLVSVLEAVLRPVLVVLTLMIAGSSVGSFVAGQTLPILLSLVWLYRVIRREGLAAGAATSDGHRQRLTGEVWRYALPLVPAAIVGWTSNFGGRYIVAGSLGNAEAGVYVAMYGAMNMPIMLLHSVVLQTLRPVYFSAVASGDKNKERRTFRVMLTATLAYGLVATSTATLLHGIIASLLFAQPYRYASYLMPWIAAGSSILVLGYIFEARLYAYKRTGRLLAGMSAGAAVSAVSLLLLVRSYGLAGAGWACPLYYGIQMLCMAVLACTISTPPDHSGWLEQTVPPTDELTAAAEQALEA